MSPKKRNEILQKAAAARVKSVPMPKITSDDAPSGMNPKKIPAKVKESFNQKFAGKSNSFAPGITKKLDRLDGLQGAARKRLEEKTKEQAKNKKKARSGAFPVGKMSGSVKT